MCLQNLMFVALAVPEIIEGARKMGSPWIRPRSPFSKIFNWLLFGWTLWMYRPNLKFVALPVPEIIAIEVLGRVQTQSWRRGNLTGGQDGAVKKSGSKFLWARHSNFSSIFMRFRYIAAFVLQHATFFHPTSRLPQISPCSPWSRWVAFGLRRAKVLS